MDQYTGQIPAIGDVKWGHGKINALAAVKKALTIVGLEDNVATIAKWTVYPNPSSATIHLQGLSNITSVELIDLSGKQHALNVQQQSWVVSKFTPGVYIFRTVANEKVYQQKIIIQ